MATILIVDDNATNRALLSRALELAHHRVVEASNGAEALGLIWTHPPDLVVTDILMPKVDGYAVDRALRAWPHTASTPVLFHTAAYTPDEVRRLLGPSHRRRILTKPLDIHELLETVTELLEESHDQPPADVEDGHDEQAHLALLNAKLLQQVRELELAATERHQLLAYILRMQEEERRRIAGDIHDDAVQAMTAVAMRLELTGPPGDDPVAVERHEQLIGTVREASTRLRRLVFQLLPADLEEHGLARTVEDYLEQLTDGQGPRVEVIDELERQPTSELRSLLYRVLQEAAANAVQHAAADHVRVRLSTLDDGFHAVVEDDGRGFRVDETGATERGHLGLASMRQRTQFAGGWLQLHSDPGAGTRVELWVPDLPSTRPEP